MGEAPRDPRSAAPAPDAANLGLLRPPLVFLASILAGVALDAVWPLALVPRAVRAPLGGAVVVAAVVLFAHSLRTFHAARTSVRGDVPASAVVRSGPYRLTRNPIYLAFSVFQLGLAVAADNPWLLATLLPAVGLMAYVVIPREERYLERRFGAAYLDYKASVRRWL